MKAWIEVEGAYWVNCEVWFCVEVETDDRCSLGCRKSHRGAVALAKRWAAYLGGLEVKEVE